MRVDKIDKMHQLEQKHWWFQGKKFLVSSALESASIPDGQYLDIGCGTGMFLRELGKERFACGLDLSIRALSHCQKDGIRNLVKASCDSLPFSSDTFALISLLDIVEHAPDDRAVLKEVYRICKPDGVVLITVPAFMLLWSSHDEANHHKRRYTRKQLASLCHSSGFFLERLTYTNFFIFLPVLVCRTVFKKLFSRGDSDLKEAPRLLNKLMQWLYKLEAAYLKRADFPWGVSLLMMLRKPT
jgi:SAM-dependent methyltransferase